MHKFDYKEFKFPIDNELLEMVAVIQEHKGEQNLYLNTQADTLTALLEIAKIQSAEASNRIEGIYTSDERLKQLVLDKTNPQNRSEREIAGYRNVLKTIHENYKYIPLKPSYVLQLHKDLYSYSGKDYGGKYKTGDNVIEQETENGEIIIRFKPVKAWMTSDVMNEACVSFNQAIEQQALNPLLLIPMFILDFLCIHPFNDGNGRMSRLLTLLLLYRSGYNVGKYVSIEKKIEQTKEMYYDALLQSSHGWHENANDYLPFVKYMLGVLIGAYREFNDRVQIWNKKPLTKPQRIIEIIKNKLGTVTKSEIKKQCADISEITVQRTLAELVENGDILKIGGGRYTKYVWNSERR
ncbi:MAG: Fic family protein [Clostridiales bacterium]|nr:Fic family protein [Clostridiales bacterium]